MNMRDMMLTLAMGLMATAAVQAAETAGTRMDGMKTEAQAQVSRTRGVVREFDARKGTVTLSHEPVPALRWPAMTMAFRISPELAKSIAVGQKVDFEFEARGMTATITRIAPAR